ncbi:MAG: DUF4097 domain-containing protein [Holophagales bacterium]|jgi:hypothetical protein|nr:DUF4097 domain-containing protein [Holophagales bacterium]
MRPVTTILITSIAVLAISTGCHVPIRRGLIKRVETRTLELKPGGHLFASAFNGSISAEGWERDEVCLVAVIRERREGDVHFAAESKNGRVEIKAEQKDRRKFAFNFGESSSASYTLQIPRKTMVTLVTSNDWIEIRRIDNEVDAKTSNGTITADEIGANARLTTSNAYIKSSSIKGELVAKTSNDFLDIRDVQGEADLRTSNAKIEVRNVKGKTSVITSNASIIASNIEGDLKGRSSNGKIDIQQILGAIDLSTSNASIKAAYLNGKGRGIRLFTSNANVDVTLGEAQGIVKAFSSGDGNKSVHFENPNIQSTKEDSATRAKIGNSDQLIEFTTSNGKITIR